MYILYITMVHWFAAYFMRKKCRFSSFCSNSITTSYLNKLDKEKKRNKMFILVSFLITLLSQVSQINCRNEHENENENEKQTGSLHI